MSTTAAVSAHAPNATPSVETPAAATARTGRPRAEDRQPARVQHDERAEREDQRQRGDLLDGGDQLVAVDERRQRHAQRRQRGEHAVEAEPAHETHAGPVARATGTR